MWYFGMKQFSLNFNGYWQEINSSGIPNSSGVYLAYRCVFQPSSNTVSLKELIYIGRSKDMRDRAEQHFQAGDLLVNQGEEICYSTVVLPESDLPIVENALIYAQKPPLNLTLKDSYSYPQAHFDISGRCALLKYRQFTITP